MAKTKGKSKSKAKLATKESLEEAAQTEEQASELSQLQPDLETKDGPESPSSKPCAKCSRNMPSYDKHAECSSCLDPSHFVPLLDRECSFCRDISTRTYKNRVAMRFGMSPVSNAAEVATFLLEKEASPQRRSRAVTRTPATVGFHPRDSSPAPGTRKPIENPDPLIQDPGDEFQCGQGSGREDSSEGSDQEDDLGSDPDQEDEEMVQTNYGEQTNSPTPMFVPGSTAQGCLPIEESQPFKQSAYEGQFTGALAQQPILNNPEGFLLASKDLERQIALAEAKLNHSKLQKRLAALRQEEAASVPQVVTFLPPLPPGPPPVRPPLPKGDPELFPVLQTRATPAVGVYKRTLPYTPQPKAFVKVKAQKEKRPYPLSLGGSPTPSAKLQRQGNTTSTLPDRSPQPLAPELQRRETVLLLSPVRAPTLTNTQDQASVFATPPVGQQFSMPPVPAVTSEERDLQNQRYGIQLGAFDLSSLPADIPAPKLEADMFEAMMRQCASGIISPEMQALCRSQQTAIDHPTNATTVDYGAPALDQLRSQLGEVSSTAGEIMAEAGTWGNPPEKQRSSTLPTLHGTGDSGSGEDANHGLPMPIQLGKHLQEVWSKPAVKVPTATKGCRMWQDHYNHFCGLVAYPSAQELKVVHTDEKTFKLELRKLGLIDRYDHLKSLLSRALLTIRLEANVQALAQFQYALVQQAVDDLLVALEDQNLAQPTRDAMLKVLDSQWGQGRGIWAIHTTSFASADVAARAAHQNIHELRRMAVKALIGQTCPTSVADELVSLPIRPGWLFGPQLVSKFQSLASTHVAYQTVSDALKTMGGQGLPSKSGYQQRAMGPKVPARPFSFLPSRQGGGTNNAGRGNNPKPPQQKAATTSSARSEQQASSNKPPSGKRNRRRRPDNKQTGGQKGKGRGGKGGKAK